MGVLHYLLIHAVSRKWNETAGASITIQGGRAQLAPSEKQGEEKSTGVIVSLHFLHSLCLLYTSDAADE